MRGRFVPLSLGRRLVVDLTRLHVPSVPVQRVMNVAPLMAARAAAKNKPSWPAMFAKAYALVAEEEPILRRAYVKLPSPRLYEYPTSSVSLVVEREYQGEMIVLTLIIFDVAGKPLLSLTETVRNAKTAPLDEIRTFRRMLDLARWPTPIRRAIWWLGLNIGRQRGNYFGTFGLTVYSGLGAESLHPISPLTGVLNYGVIAADGDVAVRIMYDHRVLDGSVVARVLGKIEEKLKGPILDELNGLAG
ncbi:MAG TPA: hypothetical protein VHA70_08270 [Bauldia sp.]|nr:hypothetical protein [Bauldia sp.]